MKIIYRACMTRIRTMQNRWNYYPTNNIQLMPIFSLDKRDLIIQAKYESWTKIISQIREAIIDLHFFFFRHEPNYVWNFNINNKMNYRQGAYCHIMCSLLFVYVPYLRLHTKIRKMELYSVFLFGLT